MDANFANTRPDANAGAYSDSRADAHSEPNRVPDSYRVADTDANIDGDRNLDKRGCFRRVND